jgi:CheY-like chemotaxis protein
MRAILLVDDDPLQAYLMMSLLGGQSAEVHRAHDAAEALCLVEQPDFARKLGLVISGHHTLGIGGPVFVAEMRSRMPAVPVLVLGMNGEKAANYTDELVFFLPRHLIAKRMAASAFELLAPLQTPSRLGKSSLGHTH